MDFEGLVWLVCECVVALAVSWILYKMVAEVYMWLNKWVEWVVIILILLFSIFLPFMVVFVRHSKPENRLRKMIEQSWIYGWTSTLWMITERFFWVIVEIAQNEQATTAQ